MIEIFEELKKEYPSSVKQFLDKGFNPKQILKMYRIEYIEIASFNVNQIKIIEE